MEVQLALFAAGFVAIISLGIWAFVASKRALKRWEERLKAEGKWKTQSKVTAPPTSVHDTMEGFGALVYFAVFLGILFVVGVVVLAVIKWAFGVVF